MNLDQPSPSSPKAHFVSRVLAVVLIVSAVAIGLWIFVQVVELLLLLFAGGLVALLIRSISNWIRRVTRMPDRAAVTATLVLLGTLVGGTAFLIAPSIADQTAELSQQIPRAVEDLRAEVGKEKWGAQVLEYLDKAQNSVPTEPGEVVTNVRRIMSSTLGVLLGLVVVAFVGIYTAYAPNTYRRGIIKLVPLERRERADFVIDDVIATLRKWLISRLLVMATVGTLTGIGLVILGVPLVMPLALLAALLEFIPNLGPILSGIPAVLLAWFNDPTKALWVIGLYVLVQILENYLLMPLALNKAVQLPPVLTIAAIISMGILLGPIGVLLADPLTVLVYVLVKRLYVEDALGDLPANRPESTTSP